jgi:hypothetical protein
MSLRYLAPCLVAAACVFWAAPARAHDNDAVHFGNNIDVGAGETVHDAVCFFCSVNIENDGKVDGDIVVFFGSVHVAGATSRDVVDFFGGVEADDGAAVGRDLVNFFGDVRLGENATVGHDMVAMFSDAELAPSAHIGGDSFVQLGWFFDVPLIAMVVVLILIAREYRRWRWRRYYYMHYPYPPPPPPR